MHVLEALWRRIGRAPVRVAFDDGTAIEGATPDAPTLHVRDRRTLWWLLWDPELAFGEAYEDGRVGVDGDLLAFLEHAYRGWHDQRWDRLHHALRSAGRRFGDLVGTRRDVQSHYDLGNDFYRLWLDRQLVYTCAYFERPEAGLEDAQVAKMEHVCRKLRLRRGERVIEAGCGWGALALHMARRHGVRVRAFNVSREQLRYARDRARREGLSERVEFVDADFRAIDEPADAFVSVGMLEHVGLANYGALGAVIDRCLDRNHGRGLLHFIGRDRVRPLNTWTRRRVFPGAYPPTLAQVSDRVLGRRGLSVLDVENLRRHYALTLDHWRRRFEASADRVSALFDERFVRIWRLYLAGSEAAFAAGSLQLFQVTFARSEDAALPWTRADLYADHARTAAVV